MRDCLKEVLAKYLKTAKILAWVAFAFSVATVVTVLFFRYNENTDSNFFARLTYCITLVGPPLVIASDRDRTRYIERSSKENPEDKRFYEWAISIGLFSIFGVWCWLLLSFIYDFVGIVDIIVPATLIIVAAVFLFRISALIKREWMNNPPDFFREEYDKIVNSKLEKENKKNQKEFKKTYGKYKALIEQCGTKFFIKYFDQLEKFSIRDVEISENYYVEEKERRLVAAKRIIDSGLTEFALRQILSEYRNELADSLIVKAERWLSANEKSKSKESHLPSKESQTKVKIQTESSITKETHPSSKESQTKANTQIESHNTKERSDNEFYVCDADMRNIVIKETVNGIPTAKISSHLLFGFENVENVTIPSCVTEIESGAFCSCESLSKIVFKGTKQQWNAIKKGDFWDSYTGDYTVYCTDGTIAKQK